MNQTSPTGDSPEARPRSWFWIGLIALGLIGAALVAHFVVGLGSHGDPGRRPPAPVATARVGYADVPETVTALGTITPLVSASVRSQQSGRLVEVDFREGQSVVKGQRLGLIDPRPFALASAQADANLARDAAQLGSARVDLARYRTLLAQDSIARQQVDSQAALVKQLESTVGADRAALGTARLNLAYASVVSPVSGRIGLRQTDPGNYVTPSDANGIATVTQLDPIDVEFSVPQARISEIQARLGPRGGGLPVAAIDQSGSTVVAQGSLLTFDNLVDATTGTVKAKARFANPGGRLIPGEFVNVSMLANTLRHAMVVPVSALRHGQPGDFVFVLQPDKTVKLVVVRIGPMLGQQVAILSGLKGDETVISAGADGLEDGSSVRLPGEKGAGGGGGAGKHHRRHRQSEGGD